MAQQIFALGMKGTGIVATLIIAGIAISTLTGNQATGNLAINSGVSIAILLGALGVFGVAKRVF